MRFQAIGVVCTIFFELNKQTIISLMIAVVSGYVYRFRDGICVLLSFFPTHRKKESELRARDRDGGAN